MDESTEEQRNIDRQRYRNCLDAVFEGVRAAIGGDEGQQGSDRWYGDARFGYDMRSNLGDVDFTISDVAVSRACTVDAIEWRTFAPSLVAEKLVAAYRALLAGR